MSVKNLILIFTDQIVDRSSYLAHFSKTADKYVRVLNHPVFPQVFQDTVAHLFQFCVVPAAENNATITARNYSDVDHVTRR